jgi:putative heme iron utilization protein
VDHIITGHLITDNIKTVLFQDRSFYNKTFRSSDFYYLNVIKKNRK